SRDLTLGDSPGRSASELGESWCCTLIIELVPLRPHSKRVSGGPRPGRKVRAGRGTTRPFGIMLFLFPSERTSVTACPHHKLTRPRVMSRGHEWRWTVSLTRPRDGCLPFRAHHWRIRE